MMIGVCELARTRRQTSIPSAVGDGLERGEAVLHDAHLVALAQQVALDDLGDDGLVLDDEDAVPGAGHARPVPARRSGASRCIRRSA
jgi:hypothetical protein